MALDGAQAPLSIPSRCTRMLHTHAHHLPDDRRRANGVNRQEGGGGWGRHRGYLFHLRDSGSLRAVATACVDRHGWCAGGRRGLDVESSRLAAAA